MTRLLVWTDECPKLPDGRRRHWYVKVEDHFVCRNCGQVSDPERRWEAPSHVA